MNKNKQQKQEVTLSNVPILFAGILVGVIALLIFQGLTKKNEIGKLVLTGGDGEALAVEKPKFLDTLQISSNFYGTYGDAEYTLFTEGPTEPRFPLCEIIPNVDNESPTYDCSWEPHEFNGNKVNVIYKDGANKKAVSILINLRKLNYGVQINKQNKDTKKFDYFTNEEINLWLEAIKKW